MAKERMKRPQPKGAKPGRREPDIKKAYTTKQLAEIGAISLIWNECELIVDFTLKAAFLLPETQWLDITTRINGLDGKLELIRGAARFSLIMTEEAKRLIKLTYDAAGEFKSYRDSIVHAITFDPDKAIGQRIGRQAKFSQVVLTEEALAAVYDRLAILHHELQLAEAIFRIFALDSEALLVQKWGVLIDPRSLRSAREAPGVIARYQLHQSKRLSLPPLPEFPDESEVPI